MVSVGIVALICRHLPGVGIYQWAQHLAVSYIAWSNADCGDQLTISVNGHMLFIDGEAFCSTFAPEPGIGVR